jgi:hypothetical protein
MSVAGSTSPATNATARPRDPKAFRSERREDHTAEDRAAVLEHVTLQVGRDDRQPLAVEENAEGDPAGGERHEPVHVASQEVSRSQRERAYPAVARRSPHGRDAEREEEDERRQLEHQREADDGRRCEVTRGAASLERRGDEDAGGEAERRQRGIRT